MLWVGQPMSSNVIFDDSKIYCWFWFVSTTSYKFCVSYLDFFSFDRYFFQNTSCHFSPCFVDFLVSSRIGPLSYDHCAIGRGLGVTVDKTLKRQARCCLVAHSRLWQKLWYARSFHEFWVSIWNSKALICLHFMPTGHIGKFRFIAFLRIF